MMMKCVYFMKSFLLLSRRHLKYCGRKEGRQWDCNSYSNEKYSYNVVNTQEFALLNRLLYYSELLIGFLGVLFRVSYR